MCLRAHCKMTHRPSRQAFLRSFRAMFWGAATAALILITSLVFESIQYIRENSIEKQVASHSTYTSSLTQACSSRFKGAQEKPTLGDWFTGIGPPPAEICDRELPNAQKCLDSVNRLLAGHNLAIPFTPEMKAAILALPGCHFEEPTFLSALRFQGVSFGQGVVIIVIGAISFALFVLAVSWVFEYPSVGWRRIAISLASLVGIGTGFTYWSAYDHTMQSIVVAIISAVGFCVAILFCRDMVLWIKAGFIVDVSNKR